jgi:hypothetical protein
MKKYILQLFLIFALSYSAKAQSLYNTYWEVYSPTGVLAYYFHVGTDTVFISTDLINYAPLTSYTVNGDTVTIVDLGLSPVSCPVIDTGHYTYAIQNDTLIYNLISDSCSARATVLATYFWVRMTTGIEDRNFPFAISVFPNPSNDGIFNLNINNSESGADKYSVYTMEGQLIVENTLCDHGNIECTINLLDFPSGIYFLTLHSQDGNKVVKLIK